MHKLKSWLAGAALLGLIAQAHAVTGHQLVDWANASDRIAEGRGTDNDSWSAAQLYGYIQAIVDTRGDEFLCFPASVTIGQLVAVTQKYVRARPEHWNKRADAFVFLALYEAFPCKK